MMRRFAVVGDKLTNNGEICDYKGLIFMLGGHQAALINGAAYCPVCKKTGYIAKEGGPRRMTLGANEIALENDVVVCGCTEHPRIFARLAGEAWYDDLAQTLGNVGTHATDRSGAAAAFIDNAPSNFDELFQLLDNTTGQPLANFEYAIERATGEIEHGVTDEDGRTHLLSSTASAESVRIYV
ncbi:PAAR domain-containing protein [Caballeronia insecticola]|uniref:PAAR domain-containing protein n=1 Tax=Caballeronia insecticola TaxID=758793 RepID=UPI0006889D43|nr:PAAR domain-containing protein [Caballeronia insecticola]